MKGFGSLSKHMMSLSVIRMLLRVMNGAIVWIPYRPVACVMIMIEIAHHLSQVHLPLQCWLATMKSHTSTRLVRHIHCGVGPKAVGVHSATIPLLSVKFIW